MIRSSAPATPWRKRMARLAGLGCSVPGKPKNSLKTLEGKETSAKTLEDLRELILWRYKNEANLAVFQICKEDIAGEGLASEKIVNCDAVGIMPEEAERTVFFSDYCRFFTAGRDLPHRLSLQLLRRGLIDFEW